ncbi:hypothetical protein KA183_08150 [bacterium]|nr:hypothetical protein [bacterium]
MKNKGAAIAVCSIILIISAAYYFNSQSNRSGTDVMGIDKNWWDDPNEQEKKFEEQYNFMRKSPSDTNSTQTIPEVSDHFVEMNQLKETHSKRYLKLKEKIAILKSQLQNTASTQEAAELKRQISHCQSKMKEMKEDDQFIQFITGQ